ncbi:MAG: sulfide:quinone oxidoreductase [Oceanospirillaceae bacterium]|jgi:sulfide:quinone oxidoreductase
MQLHQLTANLSVSPQLNVADIEQISAAGIKTIICNRPDNEGEDQPESASIREACEAQGIKWHYLPVNPKEFTDQQGIEFGQLLQEIEGPVLAYCRTGTRCTNLWALSVADKLSLDDILSTAKNAGYDVSKLSERITALAEA